MAKAFSVLVVDDFVDGRELLTEYLCYRGFKVIEASSGTDCLRLARTEHPDVVLMDLGLPDIDGWQVTKRLRADLATQDLLIIAVTAHALNSEVQKALDAGCNAVVPKPYDLQTLANTIATACRRHAAANAPTNRRTTQKPAPTP
jgi:CheY-like chemotaxis protein